MNLGIDVAFIHCPYRASAGWHADILGLPKGHGDHGWQSLLAPAESRSAIDFTSAPRLTVEKPAVIQSMQRKAFAEAR